MNITELFEQNPWWKDKKFIEHDYDILKWNKSSLKWVPEIVDKINIDGFSLHIISGPRQVGKTTALKLLIKQLLETHDSRGIFYFSCENLSDFKELSLVLNTYLDFRETSKINSSVILLDEITNPKEWFKTIKLFIDLGKFKEDTVILTGSSSINVRKQVELFPGRRGKGKDFAILPLSFRGFIKVIDPKILEKIPKSKNVTDLEKNALQAMVFEKELNNYLSKYFEHGGFPLSVASIDQSKEDAKRTYLSWIKNAILKADRSDLIARQIIKALIESLQTDVSWENVSKKIEIKSPKTVSAYVELLNSIFAVDVLYNIDLNGKKIRFGKNKKIYFTDPLLLEIFEEWCLVKSENKQTAIAESLVITHLLRAFPEQVFFWKNGQEVDAVVLEKNNLYGFEVKWSEKLYNPKVPKQFKNLVIVSKKEYSKNPPRIPLSIFLSLLDI